MDIRAWFGRNIPLPPTENEATARSICDELISLDKEVREKSYYKICEDPHIGKGVIKALIKNHKEHIMRSES